MLSSLAVLLCLPSPHHPVLPETSVSAGGAGVARLQSCGRAVQTPAAATASCGLQRELESRRGRCLVRRGHRLCRCCCRLPPPPVAIAATSTFLGLMLA